MPSRPAITGLRRAEAADELVGGDRAKDPAQVNGRGDEQHRRYMPQIATGIGHCSSSSGGCADLYTVRPSIVDGMAERLGRRPHRVTRGRPPLLGTPVGCD
jgi:hypothetical protein